nr:MAG TPA: hypothetical protein [Caudoviricetes sp.]
MSWATWLRRGLDYEAFDGYFLDVEIWVQGDGRFGASEAHSLTNSADDLANLPKCFFVLLALLWSLWQCPMRVVPIHCFLLNWWCECYSVYLVSTWVLAWSLDSSKSPLSASWRCRGLSDSTSLVCSFPQVLHLRRKLLPTISPFRAMWKTSMVKGAPSWFCIGIPSLVVGVSDG